MSSGLFAGTPKLTSLGTDLCIKGLYEGLYTKGSGIVWGEFEIVVITRSIRRRQPTLNDGLGVLLLLLLLLFSCCCSF